MNNIVYLAFALLGLIWGTNFIFMKWAAALISPEQIVLLRVLSGFVPIFGYALSRRALKWEHLRHAHHYLVMALLATAIYYYAFAKGTSLLPSSIAGMLSGAIPLFAFVSSLLFQREDSLTPRAVLGLGLGFLGVLLIARPWSDGAAALDLEGVLYMGIGSLSIGVSFVYARRFLADKEVSPLALTTYQIGFALLVLSCVTSVDGMANIGTDRVALAGMLLGLGLTGTGLAYILYYFIVQRMGALKAATVTYIPPAVALLIGSLLAHEPLRPLDLLALASILGGVYVLQSGRTPPATQLKPVMKTH
jgi:drug/metabolite transporter (DMT)-like permease